MQDRRKTTLGIHSRTRRVRDGASGVRRSYSNRSVRGDSGDGEENEGGVSRGGRGAAGISGAQRGARLLPGAAYLAVTIASVHSRISQAPKATSAVTMPGPAAPAVTFTPTARSCLAGTVTRSGPNGAVQPAGTCGVTRNSCA